MAAGNEPDALFRRYRRDAVLLHQPWPPHAGPPTNSRFGGLPGLPECYAWPRASSGRPHHFLAQIDCADIHFKTPLPERGVLFFFGRDDVAHRVWTSEPRASDHCRVVYAPDASGLTPPRQPPADLPPLRYPWKEGNVHPAWPVVPLRFDSFPDESALPPTSERDERAWRRLLERFARGAPKGLDIGVDVREAYDAQLDARRAAALVVATGARPPGKAETWREASAAIFGFAASGPHSFPQHWACIHHLARAILDRPLFYAMGEETKGEPVAEAERWLARSREVPLDRPVAEDDRQALRTWVARLDHPEPVFRGAVGTIRSWAGDPALAARVPDHVYAACAPAFYGYDEQNPRFSQMLGHAPAAHEARPVDDPTICLLNLDADRALGWHFADGGQCTFWITPRDLARRDFSNVWGRIDGR